MMAQEQQTALKHLSELIDDVEPQYAHLPVFGLALDSRNVVKGDVFLAYSGHSLDRGLDGRNFIETSVAAGAVAVLAEHGGAWTNTTHVAGVPVIPVDKLSERISEIAGRFYQRPSRTIPVMAVTGTNGKTSCTQLMLQLLNRLNKTCGVIGTLGVGVDGQLDKAINTTPDAVTIQRHLAQWREKNVDYVAMEVSSHGLEQHRVADVRFKLAMFTNLSRDHLDYHGSMQAYAAAKSKLFQFPDLDIAVVNKDDPFATTLTDLVASGTKLISYSITCPSADFYVENISYDTKSVTATLNCPVGQFNLSSPLLGAFNLSNLLGVIASLTSIGCDVAQLVNVVPQLKTVPGRMESITTNADISVVVDYAHTPDGLEHALAAMRLHCGGHLWCVFGCGGDRDHGKRQQMGTIAQSGSDHVVVTSDNPRSESPNAIIDDILCGIDIPTQVEADRAAAIEFAITNAKPGDSVLIAGKGHEDYQHIGDQLLPFSDIKQARLALKRRRAT